MADGVAVDYSRFDYWDELVQRDPSAAVATARQVSTDPQVELSVRAIAAQAEARARFDLGRLDDARAAARSAFDLAMSSERDDIRRPVALSVAVIVAESGALEEALAILDELATDSDGVDLGRVRFQEAYVLAGAGRLHDAMVRLDDSERLLAHSGEQRDQFRVHLSRGVILLHQGRLDAALSDFHSAESIAAAAGLTASRAQTIANLGVLHGRARRLADAVRSFDQAALLFAEAGNPTRMVATMEIDRAEVMMHSGLVLDAVDAARTALELVGPTGNRMLLGDAQLVLARAELAAGLLREAVSSADLAARMLGAAGRTHMVAHARSIAAHAGLRRELDADGVRRRLAETAPLVDELRASGWQQQADDLVLTRVRVARRFALGPVIERDLEHLRLGAFSSQRDEALAGWYAEALARRSAGDLDGALAASVSGLEPLDDIVAEALTLEERSAAMRLGSDLSQLTIELAVDLGDADTVLAAAEGTRARALHDELADLERHRPLTDAGAEQLRRELAGRLSDRVLVEWVVADETVWAVVFDSAGTRLVRVADAADVVRARDRVLVWLDLAAAEPDESSERAMRAADLLDDMLIGPLGLPPDCGVVNVPVGLLHGIPWAGLATFAGRPMTLVPNAQVWLEADRRANGAVRSIGFVSGPDVGSHDIERAAVEGRHPGTAIAAGAGATAPTVRSMFAGYDLVHVAAHGRFRSDRPLLSTLSLHDGESTLYDTVPDRIAARLVVLSSCEGGAQGAADGSEVLGMSSVLLARGAAAVVAPLTVVRELECADFVADVHGELAAGEPVACAVANVRGRWLSDDDLSRWAVASSFTCFGSGAVSLAPG